MESGKIEWESPCEKESHPNKCLFCHIDEVKRIYRKFAYFYKLEDREIEKIIAQVIEYHDWGKLNPDWDFDGGITHADCSAEYYLRRKWEETGDVDNEACLVALLILKHHGSLRHLTGFEKYRTLISDPFGPGGKLRDWFFKTFDFEKRVNIADAYGLFKLADCLSASNKIGYIPRKPGLKESELNEFLDNPTRRADQKTLQEMGRIGFLRAPTGWGKTTASPFYILNKRINKVFFIFPTITAINSFHIKLSNLLKNDVDKYFYFYDVEIGDENLERSHLDWRIFESQHFLKPYMITTIDQFLLAFLQVGSYHMKRVMFKNSAILLDEVHLLNDRMLFLVLYFVRKFMEIYNLHILFMSATFPDGLREAIQEMLGIKVDKKDFVDRITLLEEMCRVKFEMRTCKISEDVDKLVEDGRTKKVLVICNTVECAVKVTREIEKSGKEVKCLLLHGRFIYNARKAIEEKLEELREPHILVATQVCEVSLDMSYDVLYTEIAPLPSLIQRCGRVNRYGKQTDKVNVFIYAPEIKNEKYYPYGKDDLELSRRFLEELREIKNELELFNKLNQIYPKDEVLRRLENAKTELKLETGFENTEKTGMFFSIDVSDEEMMSILNYRESFTTLAIPYGGFICGETEEAVKFRREIEKLLARYEEAEDRASLIPQLKGYAVQIPMYAVKGCVDRRYGGLPVIQQAKGFIYHVKYGFVRNEMLDTILG